MLGTFIVFFMGVVIALAIVPQIAEEQQSMTDKLITTNETFNYSSARNATAYWDINETTQFQLEHRPAANSWEQDNCRPSSISFLNANGNATLTNATDYVINTSNGTFHLMNTTVLINASGNETYVTYTWCDEGYIDDTGGRAVAALIVLLAVVGLLGFAVYYFWTSKKW